MVCRLERAVVAGAILVSALSFRGVNAASHLWRITEVFSNSDGTVQFVELHEILGSQSEFFITHCWFESIATGNVFRFPRDLTEPTGNRYLLLGTQGFADLPAAPAPDFIIPDGFFAVDGDTLWYGPAQNYDNFVFDPGDLPMDGVNSIQVTRYAPNTVARDDFKIDVNSPTNFAGETGSIELRPPEATFVRGDCNDDGTINISDAVFLLGALFVEAAAIPCGDTCDANDDGAWNISDPVSILLALFSDTTPLPGPGSCGEDPTPDLLDCGSFSSCS